MNEQEDPTEQEWMQFIAQQWQEELADVREDIYTLEDGEPIVKEATLQT